MPDYVWIYLNIPEYTAICVNMPKSAWMAFVLHFPIVISCLLEHLIACFNVYMKLKVIVWRNTRLFLTRQNLISSVVAESIWFHFCFRLNIFTSKNSNLLLPLGTEGPRAVNLDIPTVKSWTNTKHWNQINRGRFTNPFTAIILIKLF